MTTMTAGILPVTHAQIPITITDILHAAAVPIPITILAIPHVAAVRIPITIADIPHVAHARIPITTADILPVADALNTMAVEGGADGTEIPKVIRWQDAEAGMNMRAIVADAILAMTMIAAPAAVITTMTIVVHTAAAVTIAMTAALPAAVVMMPAARAAAGTAIRTDIRWQPVVVGAMIMTIVDIHRAEAVATAAVMTVTMMIVHTLLRARIHVAAAVMIAMAAGTEIREAIRKPQSAAGLIGNISSTSPSDTPSSSGTSGSSPGDPPIPLRRTLTGIS
jgi:hypothetical protein